MSNLKKTIITALLTALGVVLPMTLHWIPNAGVVFLPMHIPVLLCGLLCGSPYGLACGLVTPPLSHLLTGMPLALMLPAMTCELAVYGAVSALLIFLVRFKRPYVNTYAALTGAMLAGRAVSGVLNALIFRAGDYSLNIWLTAAFVTALPGIVVQLLLIPAVLLALRKANLIETNDAHARTAGRRRRG